MGHIGKEKLPTGVTDPESSHSLTPAGLLRSTCQPNGLNWERLVRGARPHPQTSGGGGGRWQEVGCGRHHWEACLSFPAWGGEDLWSSVSGS